MKRMAVFFGLGFAVFAPCVLGQQNGVRFPPVVTPANPVVLINYLQAPEASQSSLSQGPPDGQSSQVGQVPQFGQVPQAGQVQQGSQVPQLQPPAQAPGSNPVDPQTGIPTPSAPVQSAPPINMLPPGASPLPQPADRLVPPTGRPEGIVPNPTGRQEMPSQTPFEFLKTLGPQESVAGEILPPTSDALTIADVMASVYQSYPMIARARLEAGVAAGEQRSAIGSWDPKLDMFSLNQPIGYYQNYRQTVALSRNLWWGGYLATGYRIGRGDMEPWYKERETDKTGEVKLALIQPLLQGFAIDPNRVALFQANIRQQSVGPIVQHEILDNGVEAAFAYWKWVAAGQVVRTQEELLRLAQVRMTQMERMVSLGEMKPPELILNSQLIAERQFKLYDTIRKLRESSFKLSLYLRNQNGQPMVPQDDWLPAQFPSIGQLPPGDFNADYAAALSRRPELQLLTLDARRSQLDLDLARNQILPQFDLIMESSQDMGEAATSLGDKSPFESELGFQGSVPLPRNKARGKVQSTQNKLAQIAQYRVLTSNKIGVELQTARNALEVAADRVNQAERTIKIAVYYLQISERAFFEGEGELLDLNILESKAYDARFYLIDAQQEWFSALAAMQRALGLDPLEQAVRLTETSAPFAAPFQVPPSIAPPGEFQGNP